jgi:hypothetical protein
MDYQFENLGPDRFQEFCQSLLLASHPDLQCFPIGQADGGRDATTSLTAAAKGSFAVFQVKYVRNPQSIQAPHKWLAGVLAEEAPKIAKLIPKGAAKYFVVTNVSGTGMSTSGSIDMVDENFKKHIAIPSQCYWRDDLSRRLDATPGLKWNFPELFTGQDLLRILIEGGLKEEQQRRATSMSMFVRVQHDREQEVRFKQVELQNKLMDLFVDVPVGAPQPLEDESKLLNWKRFVTHNRLEDGVDLSGAATFLLNPIASECFSQLVLEGAPGQGKSTITQYVCQVNRIRLLGEASALGLVPMSHKGGPVRLPIRADLRDFATWLGKRDPFAAEPADSIPPNWHRSLESFLAALVRHEAGGVDFSVDDFVETIKVSATLIVLDGLDEIADIQKRHSVISEIQTASSRLREVAASLQLIVTSRPAAFANSPGFPAATFPHLQLVALTRPLINQYAEKWLAARRLTGREAAETKSILSSKLKLPHLLALAKNPMQLAILLSLIHTRGASLPDKRTALYDAYVDLFFSREAEKSAIVRDQRGLLTDIHGYLGWVLHAAAEKGRHSGSISNAQLKELLRSYLRSEDRDPALADSLFSGMVERVVFLVSRLEGTVEFEVQPLREYFAAKYLYETAPYSPPGAEKKGTKPDRFDGLARNFYWLNVTRFYAGCFSKGELSSLVERLQELENSPDFSPSGHPRRLAAMLLADWVFNQSQRSMKSAIALVTDGITRGDIVTVTPRFRRFPTGADDNISLPEGCGRAEVVQTCSGLLEKHPPTDFAFELCETLKSHANAEEIDAWWRRHLPSMTGDALTRWLTYGSRTGALARSSGRELRTAHQNELAKAENLDVLVDSGHAKYVMDSRSLTKSFIEGWKRGVTARRWRNAPDVLSRLIVLTDPFRMFPAFQHRPPRPLNVVAMEFFGPSSEKEKDIQKSYVTDELKLCKDLVETARTLWARDASEWASQLEPWDLLVEPMRRAFGESVPAIELALLAGSVDQEVRNPAANLQLVDDGVSLCERMLYARSKSGAPVWWSEQLRGVQTEVDKLIVLSALIKWAGDATISKIGEQVSGALDSLDLESWKAFRRITSGYWVNATRPKKQLTVGTLPKGLSAVRSERVRSFH